MPSCGFQQCERADHVGAQERLRIGKGVVDVGLRSEVHDGIGFGDELADQFGVGDVTPNTAPPVTSNRMVKP